MVIAIATLNLFLIGCIAWWIGKSVVTQEKVVFWSGLVVKLSAGILLGLVYHYHYGLGDTLGFAQDAEKLSSLASQNPDLYIRSLISGVPPIDLVNHEPRAFFFTALLSIVNFISGSNYWLSSLWFSLFSFACTWYFLKRLSVLLPATRRAGLAAFLFLPSVVFWSSGIIKESLAFGALCFLAGMFCLVMSGRRPVWQEYIATMVALWLLVNLKYYWAAVFLPATVTSLIVHWLIERRISRAVPLFACWLGIFVVLCWTASLTHPNFYFERFLEVIRQNHDEFVTISSPRNLIHFWFSINDWTDVALNAPWALFSGLLRPLPHEAHSLTAIASSVENLVLLVLVFLKFFALRSVPRAHLLFVWSVLAYSILLCVFLAMSTPNFGTLSRYRIGFLPFFVLLILHDNPLVRWVFSERRTS